MVLRAQCLDCEAGPVVCSSHQRGSIWVASRSVSGRQAATLREVNSSLSPARARSSLNAMLQGGRAAIGRVKSSVVQSCGASTELTLQQPSRRHGAQLLHHLA